MISIRNEIADAGYSVAEELRAPIAKLVEFVPCTFIYMRTFHLICHTIQGV